MSSMDIAEVTGIIFAPPGTGCLGAQLQNDIENSLPEEKIALCKTVNRLADLLLPPRSIRARIKLIIVLLIMEMADLRDVMELLDLLSHFTLVMVLDHCDDELVHAACELKPHYTDFLQKLSQDTSRLVVNFIKIRNGL